MVPTDLLRHLSDRMASIVATDLVDIYRLVTVSDGMGGTETDWRRIGHNVPGAKMFRSARFDDVADSVQNSGQWSWALPVGTDVRVTDQIHAGGSVWDIVSTDRQRTQPLMVTVTANLVQEGR